MKVTSLAIVLLQSEQGQFLMKMELVLSEIMHTLY